MASSGLQWIPLPDDRIQVLGLPWFESNFPGTSRLPKEATARLPEGVRVQARFPAGGRLRLRTGTSRLHLRVQGVTDSPWAGIDIYAEGRFWRSARLTPDGETAVCFEEADAAEREFTLYLPHRQEVRILAVGVDPGARFGVPGPFSRRAPLVVYGSSIAQGIGASRPGMGYASILARRLNLDLVNLGFGGAGKAEPEVVSLVSSLPACAHLFDLGKSYGMQAPDPYGAMIDTVRSSHPDVPMVCVTPIHATLEGFSASYRELSRHARDVMRRAVSERLPKDGELLLVEGPDLLGPADADGFSADGVHPGDPGHALIAERLGSRLRNLLDREGK
jgi:hypothetical protein